MKKIQVLDQNTIDKIAAGEVVERPASVVKELVENAIDAGATAVTVEIKDGGTTFIRITDNGMGMEKEQISLAFLRHATSKIEKAEDLQHIASLGFRGEALSSISAVSQVELISKTARGFTGVRYVIEGGQEKSLEEIGAPNGTTFLVRNLFYNTPARSKFLKSNTTEAGYVSSFMEQLALSHSDISFKYMVNAKTKLHTAGNGNLKDVIYGIYGREITRELVLVHAEKEGITIDGYVGKPTISRGNRNFENYYVNGRYIKNKMITRAIEDAYQPYMMKHKYPFTALHFVMDGDQLDVNVHPTKMEVRFLKGELLYQLVVQAITQALTQKEMIPQVSLQTGSDSRTLKEKKAPEVKVPEPFEQHRRNMVKEAENYAARVAITADVQRKQVKTEEKREILDKQNQQMDIRHKAAQSAGTDIARSEKRAQAYSQPLQSLAAEQKRDGDKISERDANIQTAAGKAVMAKESERGEQMELFENKLLSEEALSQQRIIGQLFDTYWLVEYGDTFYMIDQHAAHEKVLYERIMKDLRQKQINSQIISPPIVVALTLQEIELLEQHGEVFASFGFEIEPFGGKEYSIRAVPDNLYGIASKGLFIELLDNLGGQSSRDLEIIRQKLASSACKAAVKGNQKISLSEAKNLIQELLTLDNPYHCPHGRPTIIAMTRYELEKKFKRIV